MRCIKDLRWKKYIVQSCTVTDIKTKMFGTVIYCNNNPRRSAAVAVKVGILRRDLGGGEEGGERMLMACVRESV